MRESQVLLREKWVFFNLPRHKSKTLLRAVKAAKNYFAEAFASVVAEHFENPPLAVCDYIFYFEHNNTITPKRQKVKPPEQVFS